MKTPTAIRRAAGAAHPIHKPLVPGARSIAPQSATPGFFENDWFQQKLAAAAASWIGTPFVAHAQQRGAGVDCIHLVAAIYQESGFMDSFTAPRYTIDAGAHQAESQILEWLSQHRQFVQIYDRSAPAPAQPALSQDSVLPGDLLVFKIGASEHHCGVLLGRKTFVHARAGVNAVVAIDSLTDPIYKRCLTFAFRPAAVTSYSEHSLSVGLPPEEQPSTFNHQPPA